MRTGTKSLLVGAHQFIIHPIALAIAWKRLYGVPYDPRLWIAFIVHDWGYWGKKHMDDEDGESHPIVGAKIMGFLFGKEWHDFTLLHSRFYAKKLGRPFSRLCIADKLATCIMPHWLYLPSVIMSGEVKEYMSPDAKYGEEYLDRVKNAKYPKEWFIECQKYMLSWIDSNKQDAIDPQSNQFLTKSENN